MYIGELIKYHREQHRLSMNSLARLAGVSQSGLSEVESGKRQPTFDWLERIVNALNLTWAEFFSEETPELPSELRKLLSSAQKLNSAQIEALNNFITTMISEPPAQYEAAEPEPEPKPEQTWSRWEPLAAHREDGDFMADFPDEVIQNIEEFKRFHIEETEKERKKKKGE